MQNDGDTAGADRLQQSLRKLCGQDQKRSVRWFFQRLQERICGLRHEAVRITHHRNLTGASFGFAMDRMLQLPHLLGEELAGFRFRLDSMKVGVLLHCDLT